MCVCMVCVCVCVCVCCRFLAKCNEYLRVLMSLHLKRVESSPHFPVAEFLSLFQRHTMKQVHAPRPPPPPSPSPPPNSCVSCRHCSIASIDMAGLRRRKGKWHCTSGCVPCHLHPMLCAPTYTLVCYCEGLQLQAYVGLLIWLLKAVCTIRVLAC